MAKVFFWKEAEKDYKKLDGMLKQWVDCLWQDKRTYNCSPKVHNSASSLG
jgi:predicted phage-related endonuclease